MLRFKSNNLQVTPVISPKIQGNTAYNLLSEQQKGQLRYALQNAAKEYNCSIRDLQWCIGRFGEIKIRKLQRITI